MVGNPRTCEQCKAEFQPKFQNQKLCIDCWKKSKTPKNSNESQDNDMVKCCKLNNRTALINKLLETKTADWQKTFKEAVELIGL